MSVRDCWCERCEMWLPEPHLDDDGRCRVHLIRTEPPEQIRLERDRLRAAVDAVLADVARWREHAEARARGGQHVGTGGEIGNLSHSTAAYLERVLRAAGGEP